MSTRVKRAARAAESSTPLRALARAGFVANGVVHVLIGVIVLVVAFGGRGESDQAGAFKAIGAAPLGFAALWLLAIALWALAVWHGIEAVLARGAKTTEKWRIRLAEIGQALVFAALGVVAASVALGARPDGDEAVEGASRDVLALPGGAFVLGLVGVAIGIGGLTFIWMGLVSSFRSKMSIPGGAFGSAVNTLGVWGFIAKGVALVIVGILLVVAAVKVDPDAAGGLDGAIQALLALPYGPLLAGAVGVGLILYGVFCGFRARYARL